MSRRRSVLAAVALLLIAGCGGDPGSAVGSVGGSGATTGGSSGADPGWRWESFGGIELQVPKEWGNGTSGVAGYGAWCADRGGGAPSPGVNRGPLALMPAIACPEDRPADSYAAGVDLGTFPPFARRELAGSWAVEAVEVAGVSVAVTSDDPEQMAQVTASVRPVQDGIDVHGCPVDSELRQEGSRPVARSGPPGVPGPAEVVAVSACRYLLPGSTEDLPHPLLASTLLQGADAAALIEEVVAAPPGSGPDDDSSCAASTRLGEELVVLRVDDGTGVDEVHEVVVRYSGCGGHGVDDGTTARRLTGGLLQQLFVGPLAPTTLAGVVARLTS
ncbi:hypothetical protein [Aquipuribacter hungaricus]|uniref:hypothetical protein n=1 Tax=Aquipuribacter hungaricus TaxID=545624 RepID=UPI0030EDF209